MFTGRGRLRLPISMGKKRALFSAVQVFVFTLGSLTTIAPAKAVAASCTDAFTNTSNITIVQSTPFCVIKIESGSKTWTAPTGMTSVNVLLVAGGGGGGGGAFGGGGGGGQVVVVNGFSVTPGASYSLSVGGGGAGGTDALVYAGGNLANIQQGIAGSNSTFSTLTATGGGGGGGYYGQGNTSTTNPLGLKNQGGVGGSSGGSAEGQQTPLSVSSYSGPGTAYGNVGGIAGSWGQRSGGGGGGSASVGGAGGNVGGAGGNAATFNVGSNSNFALGDGTIKVIAGAGGGANGDRNGAGGFGGGGAGGGANGTGIGAGGGGHYGQAGSGATGAIYLSYPVFCTGYTFTGPTSGSKNAASTNFTITPTGPTGCTYNGTISVAVSGGGLSSTVSKTFTASGSAQTFTITPTAAGDVTLTPTSSPQLGTNPAAITYNIPKTSQPTLSFTPSLVTAAYSGSAYSQALTMTPSGGAGDGTTTYAIVAGGGATGCALSSNTSTTTITASSSGTCLIQASRTGDVNYNSATSANVTFTFTRATAPTLSFTLSTSTSAYNGSPYSQALTLTPTGGSSSTASYAIVAGGSASGCTLSSPTATTTITASSRGTCWIQATKAEDTYYSAATSETVIFTFTRAAAPTLSFTLSTTSAIYNGSAFSQALTLTSSGGSSATASYAIYAGGSASGCALSSSTATTTITATGSGTCLIRATKAEDDNYNSATSENVTFTFNKANQPTLSFTLSTSTSAYSGTAYSQALTMTPSGGSPGGTITYAIVAGGDAATCRLIAGTISATTIGTCWIQATKPEDNNYNAATSETVIFTFIKANQSTLTITTTQIRYNTPITLGTSGGLGNGLVTYTLVPGDCTLIGDSITGNRFGGTCSVVAKKAASANYEEIYSSSTILTIIKGIPTGDLYFSPAIAVAATYQASHPLIASASQLSKVTFLANGVAIPGCSNVPTKAGIGAAPSTATCNFKPVSLGSITVTANITPINSGYSMITKTTKVRVNPK